MRHDSLRFEMQLYLQAILCYGLLQSAGMTSTQLLFDPDFLIQSFIMQMQLFNLGTTSINHTLRNWERYIFSESQTRGSLSVSGSVLSTKEQGSLKVTLCLFEDCDEGMATRLHAAVCAAAQLFYSKKLQKYTSYNFTQAKHAGWHRRRKMLLMVVAIGTLSMSGQLNQYLVHRQL